MHEKLILKSLRALVVGLSSVIKIILSARVNADGTITLEISTAVRETLVPVAETLDGLQIELAPKVEPRKRNLTRIPYTPPIWVDDDTKECFADAAATRPCQYPGQGGLD